MSKDPTDGVAIRIRTAVQIDAGYAGVIKLDGLPLPLSPPSPVDNYECPICGDEAFFVDLDDDRGFSCDGCEYMITEADDPAVTPLVEAWLARLDAAR